MSDLGWSSDKERFLLGDPPLTLVFAFMKFKMGLMGVNPCALRFPPTPLFIELLARATFIKC